METRELLEKFKKENEPQMPLYRYKKEILNLRNDGYSLNQIVIFLSKFLEIKTNKMAISRLLKQIEQDTYSLTKTDNGASKIEAKEAEEDSGYKTAADFFLNSKIEN